jgi:hypothetical protein
MKRLQNLKTGDKIRKPPSKCVKRRQNPQSGMKINKPSSRMDAADRQAMP